MSVTGSYVLSLNCDDPLHAREHPRNQTFSETSRPKCTKAAQDAGWVFDMDTWPSSVYCRRCQERKRAAADISQTGV
jgi:hypothetical protein